MLIAIDKNNNRILPKKNSLGFCQLCKKRVRAYCGEINIHHWRHIELQSCDSWKENETEWHRKWKNEFPEEWQEVIIEKNHKKHIADILTPNNLILELQNSSISSTTIKIRESFYGNMIWLINANKFEDNFSIRSKVKSQLRYLDEEHRSYDYYEPQESTELKQISEEIDDIEYDLKNIDNNISNVESKIKEVKELSENIKTTAKQFIHSTYSYLSVIREFKSSEKNDLERYKKEEEELTSKIQDKQEILTRIKQFENCEIKNFEHFKYIAPNGVSSSSYSKCALIEKETEKSLFPKIIKFKSQLEFERIAKNQKYRLIVNPLEKITKTENQITDLQNKIDELHNKKLSLKRKIKSQLKSFLIREESKFKENLILLKEEKTQLKKNLALKVSQSELIEIRENEKEVKEAIAIEKHYKNNRFKIMKNHKGLYNYQWKYKRKSWDFSEKKIYLDFENAIFEMINDSTLRKLKKTEFIEKVKNWW